MLSGLFRAELWHSTEQSHPLEWGQVRIVHAIYPTYSHKIEVYLILEPIKSEEFQRNDVSKASQAPCTSQNVR